MSTLRTLVRVLLALPEILALGAEAIAASLRRLLTTLLALAFLVLLAGLVLAVPVGLVYSVYQAFPDEEINPKPDGTWLDLIFGDEYVVFAARIVIISLALVLLFGGLYMAISIFVRTYRKEWLKRAGGFEAAVVERAAADVDSSKQEFATLAGQLIEENEDLEARLEAALAELETRPPEDE